MLSNFLVSKQRQLGQSDAAFDAGRMIRLRKVWPRNRPRTPRH
jgi:hypothetical protein